MATARSKQGKKFVETRDYSKKHYVRYKEGAKLYSMGMTRFQELAHEAGAVCKVGGVCLVDCEIVDKYIAQYREFSERGFYNG